MIARLALMSLLLAPFALSGCTAEKPLERPAASPAAAVVGEAVSCVSLGQVRETRIRDDWTIDFIGTSGEVWRNTLTTRCAGLRMSGAITYETSISQLCDTDIVYVLLQVGGRPQRGVGCSLGKFVPVRLER